MNLTVLRLLAFAVALGVSGCVGSKVTWIDAGAEGSANPGGKYSVTSMDGRGAVSRDDALVEALASSGVNIVDVEMSDRPQRDIALPVTLKFERRPSRSSVGGIGIVNNMLSVCTLGVWPYYQSEEAEVVVELRTPTGTRRGTVTVGGNAWSSFILPIAILPCPGWGEQRSCGENVRLDIPGDMAQAAAVRFASQVLTDEFYEKEMAKWIEHCEKFAAARKKAVAALMPKCQAAKSVLNERPVLLIDDKDVVNKTDKKQLDLTDIASRMESELNGVQVFKIVSRRSVERGIAERNMFQMLSGAELDLSGVKVPAFRMEMVLLQYDASTKTQPIREWYKDADYGAIGTLTRISASAELMLKITDMRTGETMFADQLREVVSDSSEQKTVKRQSSVEEIRGEKLQSEEYYLGEAVNQVIRQFCARIASNQGYAIVGCSKNGVLAVNAPASSVAVGDRLKVYNVERGSGMEIEVATIKIIKCQGSTCIAEFVEFKDVDCEWNVIVRK